MHLQKLQQDLHRAAPHLPTASKTARLPVEQPAAMTTLPGEGLRGWGSTLMMPRVMPDLPTPTAWTNRC